jgi:glycosyltransferase involved in cell wall biosynthesis
MWERAIYLARQGHSVGVVTSRWQGAPSTETIDGVSVVRLGGIYSLWWRTFLHYARRCRGRYDVIVTEGFGGSRIPRFAPLYVKEPIITEWHQIHRDLFATQYPAWMRPTLNALERFTAFIHRDTTLVVRTEEWRQAFPQLGFKPRSIAVVPACIGEEWLAASQAEPVVTPQIIWIGKFRRYKCPDHVIRAMTQVLQHVPAAQLVLIGRHDDRRYEKELQSLVEELNLTSSVRFSFGLSEKEKRLQLRRARVMALPSVVEGFGIVVLEANASGVPVVASSGVPPSVVGAFGNGLRYPFGDIGGLARCLATVLLDDARYQSLSKASREFADGFGFLKVCAQYEAVIRETVRPRGALAASALRCEPVEPD